MGPETIICMGPYGPKTTNLKQTPKSWKFKDHQKLFYEDNTCQKLKYNYFTWRK